MIFSHVFSWQVSRDCLFRCPRFLLVHGVVLEKPSGFVSTFLLRQNPGRICHLFHSKRWPTCSNFLNLFLLWMSFLKLQQQKQFGHVFSQVKTYHVTLKNKKTPLESGDYKKPRGFFGSFVSTHQRPGCTDSGRSSETWETASCWRNGFERRGETCHTLKSTVSFTWIWGKPI